MKAKQVVACLFIVIGLLVGSVQASEQPKINIEEKPKIEKGESGEEEGEFKNKQKKYEHFFVKINKKVFQVSKEVLEQFGVYKANEDFEKKLKTETETPSIIKDDKTITWNITDLFKRSVINTGKDYFFIKVLLDIALGKIDPYDIPQKTLFAIIKIADFLGNDKVMNKCTPALISKLTGTPCPIDFSFAYENVNNKFGINLLPNGSGFITKSVNMKWQLWNINQSNPILTFNGADGLLYFLPNGSGFIAMTKKRKWKFWDKNQPNPTLTFNGVDGYPRFLPDSSGFIAMTKEEEWKFWDKNQPNPILTFNGAYDYPEFLPNVSGFIAKTKNREWQRWNINQSNPILIFNGVGSDPELLPNGSGFIAMTKEGECKLWKFETPNPILTFNGVGGYPYLLPNGSGFIAKTKEGEWEFWNINQSDPILTFNEVGDRPYFKFLPDSSGFVAEAKDGQLKLWKFVVDLKLSFEQIQLVYKIFTSEKATAIKKDSYDYKTLKSLPTSLRKAIAKFKLVKITKSKTKNVPKKKNLEEEEEGE